MILKANIIVCENEHGTGDVLFPDLTLLSGYEFTQLMIGGNTISMVRKAAKAAGWRRVNGADYCPACMATMEDQP